MVYSPEKRDEFLNKHGWQLEEPLAQDTSIRRYFRVSKASQKAILMESVPDHSPLMTRGHRMTDFVRLSSWLNEVGLNAPDVIESDLDHGYMILEDFGSINFNKALRRGDDAAQLFRLGVDVLEVLKTAKPPPGLNSYYQSHVHANHRFVMDYYFNKEELVSEYLSAWNEIEEKLSPMDESFLHIDFHAENLMLVEGKQGVKRCGILDFQGAMIGPAPYDLANLLEDARTDCEPDLRAEILQGYDEEFLAHYRVLGTQFHCRVIGQFIKIALETGNKSYLLHLPRLEQYISNALNDPLLKPLKLFFDNYGLDFSLAKDLNDLQLEQRKRSA